MKTVAVTTFWMRTKNLFCLSDTNIWYNYIAAFTVILLKSKKIYWAFKRAQDCGYKLTYFVVRDNKDVTWRVEGSVDDVSA